MPDDLLPRGTTGGKKQQQNYAHRFEIVQDNDMHGPRYAMSKWNVEEKTLLKLIETVDSETKRRRGGFSPINRLAHRQDHDAAMIAQNTGDVRHLTERLDDLEADNERRWALMEHLAKVTAIALEATREKRQVAATSIEGRATSYYDSVAQITGSTHRKVAATKKSQRLFFSPGPGRKQLPGPVDKGTRHHRKGFHKRRPRRDG